VVQRKREWDGIIIPVHNPRLIGKDCVGVDALVEAASLLVELDDLRASPVEVIVVVAGFHPVDRYVAALLNRIGDLATSVAETHVLQRSCADPARTGQKVRADHASAVVVVPFVPPVVLNLVSTFRVHKREQHGSDLHGVVIGILHASTLSHDAS